MKFIKQLNVNNQGKHKQVVMINFSVLILILNGK